MVREVGHAVKRKQGFALIQNSLNWASNIQKFT